MAATESSGRISLRGVPEGSQDLQPGSSSAILFKLSDGVLQDLKRAQNNLHFSTGSTPKLRIGSRTIDLSISNDDFRNELFASTTSTSVTDFTFRNLVSHRAELKVAERKSSDDTASADAALAALKNSLASYQQEKDAKKATVTNSILPIPKSRFDAARKERQDKKRGITGGQNSSYPASPLLSAANTPRLGPAPTSVPASEEKVKLEAMKVPVTHLLAMRPASLDEIAKKTHIPKEDLNEILPKTGKQSDGKWQLTDRAYKDLDIWKFQYPSEEGRKAAVENAVKAFDRLRLGKDDQIWQMLLPKNERGKGKCLSRLHFGSGQVNRGLTPNYQPSPMPHAEGATDSKTVSGANTPRPGGSTPRPGSSKGDVMKRLLSKDPKKTRAAEEAKEKKRKEREMAASDRESGRPAKKVATKKADPKKTDPKIKSAEFVHSSDDESGSEGEIKVESKKPPKAIQDSSKKAPNSRPKATRATSSDSSDVPLKSKKIAESTTSKSKADKVTAKTSTPPAAKASEQTKAAGKSTPQKAASKGLSAPNSQQKSQPSPQFPNSRPSVPSPLGAARPRVASDVSDRGAVGVQKVRQGADTLKGLGISDATQNRQDTPAGTESAASHKLEKGRVPSEKPSKPTMNGTPQAKPSSGTKNRTDGSAKRKAEDSPSQQTAKHRKTDSGSSQSLKSQSSTAEASNEAARSTPEITFDKSSSDGADSVIGTLSFDRGVDLAQKLRDHYYPAYTKAYDELTEKKARGEEPSREEMKTLMRMHNRLKAMKQEISMASQREPAKKDK